MEGVSKGEENLGDLAKACKKLETCQFVHALVKENIMWPVL
jgi:hypothetical protein